MSMINESEREREREEILQKKRHNDPERRDVKDPGKKREREHMADKSWQRRSN